MASEFLRENYPRGGGISRRKKIEVFLRFVGDPGFQYGIAEDVGVQNY